MHRMLVSQLKRIRTLVVEPDGVVHQVRSDTAAASYQAITICGIGFYFEANRHLWQEPPIDRPWFNRIRLNDEESKVTCLQCLASL